MAYPFIDIEKKWQKHWAEKKTFRAENTSSKPKYYVLDMFPYPSGAGLHVGHPLGYIASDIVARYKRLKGFNVLHPMGYDSFGLPAEQYAIQTGQHPAVTTESNIARYREQMDKIGFSFDWSREVRTSDPNYYKWTQWIFLKLFNSWYNPTTNKAEDISTLIEKLNTNSLPNGQGWAGASTEKEKSDLLMNYRLAYLSEAWVNWCPQLGTVLANEEVKDGVSERGGYPVERKLMPQWSLRITAYAERLLNDLETIDWSDSIKESQRNWIGRSEGSSLRFKVANSKLEIEVFTTRPDTIFGVTFLTLAPENEIVLQITTPEQKAKVDAYITYAKNRSERDRQADVKKITGEFTGAYALHPFTGKKIPVWIGDYVLATYGTGAVMAVPSSDERDHKFAKHFDIPVIHVIEGTEHLEDPCEKLHGTMINSDFLNGMESHAAIKRCIQEIEKRGLGKGKTQFRLRDAIFGRQRYWGEPIPMYYDNGIPKAVDEKDLPIIYLVGGFCTLFSANYSGKLSDKYGKRKIFIIMAAISAISVYTITNMKESNIYVATLITSFFMIAITGRVIPSMAMITGSVESKYRGGFMSLNSCTQNLASAIAASLSGLIIIKTPEGLIENFNISGYICIAMTIIAILISLFLNYEEKASD